MNNATQQGIEIGLERGMELGMERGIEQGIEQGIELGAIKGKVEIYYNELNFTPEEISKKLGISLANVQDFIKNRE